jgi:hypothetical protein
MRSKKNNQVKKYQLGGKIALGTGALQAGLGAYQLYEGFKMAKDIKEAPIKKPSEYAEMLKLSRQADLERRRMEEINRSTATAISAAQQAGGRAVVGALPGMIRSADLGTQNLLAQRQALQMGALQRSAIGSEAEIARGLTREQQQRMAAQAAVEGGIQNIAGALGGVGKAAVLGAFDVEGKAKEAPLTGESQLKKDIISARAETARERRIGESAAAGMEDLIAERESLLAMGPEEPRAAFGRGYDRRAAAMAEGLASTEDLMAQREALSGLTNEQYDALLRMKDLGLINFNTGGKMTKGAFNHKTNPIDIVQAGNKVGEMTGGEVILNPSQQKRLSKESAYFRSLLKKFNKQK